MVSFSAVLRGPISGEHLQAAVDILCERQKQSVHITSSMFALLIAGAAHHEAHTVVLQGWEMMREAGVRPTPSCATAHLAALVALVRFTWPPYFPCLAVSAMSLGVARAVLCCATPPFCWQVHNVSQALILAHRCGQPWPEHMMSTSSMQMSVISSLPARPTLTSFV